MRRSSRARISTTFLRRAGDSETDTSWYSRLLTLLETSSLICGISLSRLYSGLYFTNTAAEIFPSSACWPGRVRFLPSSSRDERCTLAKMTPSMRDKVSEISCDRAKLNRALRSKSVVTRPLSLNTSLTLVYCCLG